MARQGFETAAQTRQRRQGQLAKARRMGNVEKIGRLEGKLGIKPTGAAPLAVGSGQGAFIPSTQINPAQGPLIAQAEQRQFGVTPLGAVQSREFTHFSNEAPLIAQAQQMQSRQASPMRYDQVQERLYAPQEDGGKDNEEKLAADRAKEESPAETQRRWLRALAQAEKDGDETRAANLRRKLSQGTPTPGGRELPAGATVAGQPAQTGPSFTEQYRQAIQESRGGPGFDFDTSPEKFGVREEATVAGQLKRGFGADSPLMRQAEAFARQRMNASGQVGSSIGIGASQDALIRQGLAIAAPDAATYDRAATNTVNAINRERLELIARDTTLTVAERNNLSAQIIAQGNNESAALLKSMGNIATFAGQQLSADTMVALGNMDNANQFRIQELMNAHSATLQTSQAAAALLTQHLAEIGRIYSDPKMDPQAKDDAILTLQNQVDSALALYASFSDLEIGKYFEDLEGDDVIEAGAAPPDGAEGTGAAGTEGPVSPFGPETKEGRAVALDGESLTFGGVNVGGLSKRAQEQLKELVAQLGVTQVNRLRFKEADQGMGAFFFQGEDVTDQVGKELRGGISSLVKIAALLAAKKANQ